MMSVPPITSPSHTSTYCSPIHSPRASCSPSPRQRRIFTSSEHRLSAAPASLSAAPSSASSTTSSPHPTPRKLGTQGGLHPETMTSKVTLSPLSHRRHRAPSGQPNSTKQISDPPLPSPSGYPTQISSSNLFARDLAMAAAEKQTQAPRPRKISSAGARAAHKTDHHPYSPTSASQSPKWTRRRREPTAPSSGDEDEATMTMIRDNGNNAPLESPTSESGEAEAMSAPAQTSLRSFPGPSSVPQKRSSHAAMPMTSTPAASSSSHLPPTRKPRSSIPSWAEEKHPTAPAHALEDHFAQVSMTPPANFGSHAYRESPFGPVSAGHIGQQPATDLRKHAVASKLPRSSAFGPFSPLTDANAANDGRKMFPAAEFSSSHGQVSAMRRTSRLNHLTASHQRRLALLDGDEDSSGTSADERSVSRTDGAASPSLRAAEQGRLRQEMRSSGVHARAKTADSPSSDKPLLTSTVAARRGRTPTFLITKREEDEMSNSMDLDSDAEIGAPPSPTPGADSSFSASGSGNLSSSSAERNLLQPGRLPHQNVGRRRSLATGTLGEDISRSAVLVQQNTSAPLLMQDSPFGSSQLLPRHNTSPSFAVPRSRHKKNVSSSSSSSSNGPPIAGSVAMKATKSASSSSPYKAKRRLAVVGRNGPRTRAISSIEDQVPYDTGLPGHRNTPDVASFDGAQEFTFGSPNVSADKHRRQMKHQGGIFASVRGEVEPPTPMKLANLHQDDSGFACASFSGSEGTPFRAGDRLLSSRLGMDDTPEKGLFAPQPPTPARKSCSYDSLTSTPAKAKPASANHRGPFNPFKPIHKSSLAHETSLVSTPTGTDSGASSPEHASSHRTASVPEGLSVLDTHTAYLTPQNFKNIKPLQTAFMSTGLVSKRARGLGNGVEGDLAPLPPRPNFASGSKGSGPAAGNGGMATAMGLREVVAATSARATIAGSNGSSAMPDTPMKKPQAGSLAHHMMGAASNVAARQPPPSVLRPTAGSRPFTGPPMPSLLSPTKDASSETESESPLLGAGTCDSPTMNLVSVSNSNNSLNNGKATEAISQFSTLPKEHDSPPRAGASFLSRESAEHRLKAEATLSSALNSEDESQGTSRPNSLVNGREVFRRTHTNVPGRSGQSAAGLRRNSRPPTARSISEQAASTRFRSRVSDSQNSECSNTSEGEGNGSVGRPSFMRHRSRPNSGLQRKASFGVGASEQQTGVGSPTIGFFPVPSTPTRHSGHIKWFEAARVVTTPSPPSRRQGETSLRYSHGGSKSKSLKGKPTASPATPNLATASQAGRFESQFVQLSVLGSGEFSEAVKAEDRQSGNIYAVKRMKRRFTGPKDRLRHLEEVDILRLLGSHPNVISLTDAWEEDNHLFIQTELCPLGTLSLFLEGYGYLVGHLDEPRLWKMLTELSLGIQHIHSHGVLHLDLKPANVFVTSVGSLKIGDFGLASRWPPAGRDQILAGAQLESESDLVDTSGFGDINESAIGRRADQKSVAGNLEREGDREYLAPEVMLDGEYSEAVDIFALGLIMVEAVGNVILPDNGEPWQKLRNDDLSDVDFSNISVSLFRLIQQMLSSAPHKRPTVDDILAHPVVGAVQEKMREGLKASELDQLPDFELPEKALPGELSTILSDGSLASKEDAQDSNSQTDSSSVSGCSTSVSGTSYGHESTHSGKVAGSDVGSGGQHGPAVPIRGALIQEADDFLAEVLQHDPDSEARELVPAQEHDTSFGDGSFNGLGLEAWTEEGESNIGDESYILGNHFADETFEDGSGWSGHHEERREEMDGMDIDVEDIQGDEDAFL